MSKKIQLAGLCLVVPDEWFDTTEELPSGSPFTLSRADGIGALQFSLARYKSGELPGFQLTDLKDLLAEFSENHDLGAPSRVVEAKGTSLIVCGDYPSEEEFIRLWYVSNGQDLAFVSYVTQDNQSQSLKDELREATSIVESLGFV